jgi:GH25 family lysozyme M1 (1,4-beta-N-acetylmuramidase)
VGLDVSRWQSAGSGDTCAPTGIDWAKVSRTSRTFTFIRATRTTGGVTSADACFARNWAGAEVHGLYRGAYHYAVPSTKAGSAAHDARAFVAVTGRMQDPGDLPPVLDLETSGGLTVAQLSAWTSSWLTTVRALTGRQPMIYTYPSFWRSAMADSQAFHAYPLWIANWTTGQPSVPGHWPTYTMHQYSASGRVSGVAGDVDLDAFNGSTSALASFAHPAAHVTAVTSGATAYRGSIWSLSGHLRTTTGTTQPGRNVHLYRRLSGSASWSEIATARTSASGAYRFDLRPTAAASYRVRFSGSTTVAASWSATRSHAIRDRSATTTELTASAASVKRSGAVQLSGHLTRTRSGAQLTGKHVTVYQRVDTGAWTAIRTLTTSATTAHYALTVHPTRTTQYRVSFAGSLSNLPSTSTTRVVTVR